MKAIIVDDEPKAIELLRGYLSHFKSVSLEGTFRNGLKAFEFLNKESVDLIFLDINMPHISGISLSKMLPSDTRVVFTTAYSEYAVESYEVQAVDYLLKPISLERFTRTMGKILGHAEKERETPSQTIILKSGGRLHKLRADRINYLEKDGNYMTYHLEEGRILAREPVHRALKHLPPNFLQVHKSYIVNLSKVDSIERDLLYMGSVSLPIGGTFKARLLELFSKGGQGDIDT